MTSFSVKVPFMIEFTSGMKFLHFNGCRARPSRMQISTIIGSIRSMRETSPRWGGARLLREILLLIIIFEISRCSSLFRILDDLIQQSLFHSAFSRFCDLVNSILKVSCSFVTSLFVKVEFSFRTFECSPLWTTTFLSLCWWTSLILCQRASQMWLCCDDD